MNKRVSSSIFAVLIPFFVIIVCLGTFFNAYRRPCRKIVERLFPEPALVFALIKAESGFRADAVSSAGAVGLMQLLPSTAEYVCEREGMEFDEARLSEQEYNVTLGCLYLKYLLRRFPVTETAVAAYNAGEGVVGEWLGNPNYSKDGKSLLAIPYPETRAYVKKIVKFKKIYSYFD